MEVHQFVQEILISCLLFSCSNSDQFLRMSACIWHIFIPFILKDGTWCNHLGCHFQNYFNFFCWKQVMITSYIKLLLLKPNGTFYLFLKISIYEKNHTFMQISWCIINSYWCNDVTTLCMGIVAFPVSYSKFQSSSVKHWINVKSMLILALL